MDYSAGMHTVEELQEMMKLRQQMEVLQARYAAILKRPLENAPPASPSPQATAPIAEEAAAPEQPSVASPATPATVTPPPAPAAAATATVSVPEPPTPKVAVKPKNPDVKPKAKPAAPTPTVTPKAVPKAASTAPKASTAASGGGGLQEAIAGLMREAGKPLAFDEIYAGLEASGYALPEKKPKLVVRKTLFKKSVFKMVGKDKMGQGKYEPMDG